MQAIILAAGMGSRLNNAPDHLPKALNPVMGTSSILEFQLQGLMRFLPFYRVSVVVGYKKNAIIETFPNLRYIENPDFHNENTSKSLLRALEGIDDDVLWMNGDVMFRPSIVHRLIEENRTAMVVNQAIVDQEEVKYRTDSRGAILEVSKEVSTPQGEALGINFFKKDDIPLLRDQLEKCRSGDFFEKAIEGCIRLGLTVWTLPVEAGDCVEIDFPEDLIRARELMHQWMSGS